VDNQRLTIAMRIRCVKLGFQAECALLDKAHLYKLSAYAIMPLSYKFLPDSVHACEDIGRRALREMLEEEAQSKARVTT
jgi:hypothetical protein